MWVTSDATSSGSKWISSRIEKSRTRSATVAVSQHLDVDRYSFTHLPDAGDGADQLADLWMCVLIPDTGNATNSSRPARTGSPTAAFHADIGPPCA